MTKQVKYLTKQITEEINSKFGDRVRSFVLFGTSRTKKVYSDIDLELMLDQPHLKDFQILNNILSKHQERLDFHISYKSQLERQIRFRRKAQGSYLLYSLANGQLLLGKNNYYKTILKKAPKQIIQQDLYIKNQEYQYSLREFLLEGNFLSKRIKFSKYLLRYLYQISILKHKLTYKQVFHSTKNNLLQLIILDNNFTKETQLFLHQLFGNKKYSKYELITMCSKILYETDLIMGDLGKEVYD